MIDIYRTLKEYDINITIYAPWANLAIAQHEYGDKVVNGLPSERFDAAIMAAAHDKFTNFTIETVLKAPHVVFDVKGTLSIHVDGQL